MADPCGQSTTLSGAFTLFGASILKITPDHGALAGGTPVLIQGANFLAGCTVKFGTSPATAVTFIDDQHYSVVTPNHAVGHVDVVITEPSGQTVTFRNGFQYTFLIRGNDIRRMPGIQIRDVLNNTPNTCTFTVDGNSNLPTPGEQLNIVDVADSSRLLFAGNVQAIEQIYEELTTQLAWQVTCIDFTWLINRRRPFGIYNLVSVTDIVKDMVARFAPGFTAVHVQTNLAKVSVTFDGSMDFQTCLTTLASAIGGGHWYVDYFQDVHFFHVVPPNIQVPTEPESTLRAGPGTAMVVAEGALIPSTFQYTPAYYIFQSSFVYDNGAESALSPASNVLAAIGTKQISFTGLPIGAAAGTHPVVARRIYVSTMSPVGGANFTSRGKFCQVSNNTLANFTVWFGSVGASDPAVIQYPGGLPPAAVPYVAPPAYVPTVVPAPLTAAASAALTFMPPGSDLWNGYQAAFSFTSGAYAFKVSNLYQDLTESQPGPASNLVTLDGSHMATLSNIPLGETINGVPVIARRVYASRGGTWGSDTTVHWFLIKDNTTTTVDVGPGIATYGTLSIGAYSFSGAPAGNLPVNTQDVTVPLWPNPDGPSLELDNPPTDITSTNVDLLREPPFRSTVDLSQVRNRISLRGIGTSMTLAAVAGATTLLLTELKYFSISGGTIYIDGLVMGYTGISAPTGPGTIFLSGPLLTGIPQGSTVQLFLQVDDLASQKSLGAVELDKDGLPTDGIHEYVIVDNSLTSAFQLYMRGYAELELFAWPVVTINYATRDPNTRSGKIVHVNLTDPPCVGDFLIQDVTIDQVHDESETLRPRYTVVASSIKFEMNDLLLQLFQKAINSGGGSASLAGVITATVGQVPAVAAIPRPIDRSVYWTELALDNMTGAAQPTTSTYGWAVPVFAPAFGGVGVSDSSGYWFELSATAAGEGGDTRVTCPSNTLCLATMTATLKWRIRLVDYSTAASHVIVFLILAETGTSLFYDGPANGNVRSTNATRKFLGLRLDNRGWAGVMGDGVTCVENNVGFASAVAGGTYLAEVSLASSICTVSITGSTGPAASASFAVSSGLLASYFAGQMQLFNAQVPGTTGKTMRWKAIYGERV